jgi:hypothetical protein
LGYYVRILSPSENVPSISRVKEALSHTNLAGNLVLESGPENDWIQLTLSHPDGTEIANIERDSAARNDLVPAEIEEFIDEIADAKPATAVAWLADYLPSVKTIYALQILNGINTGDGWDVFGTVKELIFTGGRNFPSGR